MPHLGPTAQDFREAFGLGSNDETISTIDPSGIALVALQEVLKQNRELSSRNQRLEEKVEKLSRQVEALVSTR